MRKNLVIVESPAKAKTIEKFLGDEFKVTSSYGHIRDLDKKDLGIDTNGNFAPHYIIPDEKRKVVSDLAKAAKAAETVWLASDEDREGEAIAWHLAQVLGLPLDSTKRIVFHEITKKAILEAIENPRTVDMNLVNSQQARRVLDRLVGFELSPVLWKKVKPQLSAGRVQSVAVRLIVEREREIIDFKTTSYYRVVAQFTDVEGHTFRAELDKRFDTEAQARDFLSRVAGGEFRVVSSEMKPAEKVPAAPFTTSTLQQEAGRKLGMSVSQTMSVAQKLYESGFITYMRTDSVNLSSQAMAAAKSEIFKHFGEEYYKGRNYKTKSKGAQEAHEAIRPSYIDRTQIEGSTAEKRLYELIWKRTVASQMASAKIDKTIITIAIGGQPERFVATGEVVRFDGFMKLYSETTDEEVEGAEGGLLPVLAEGALLAYSEITATERFTQPPYRYSEAMLVKKMEELGIGRPSTYAPTITTIINRGYVLKRNIDGAKRNYRRMTLVGNKIAEKSLQESYGKEKGRLTPTDIGMLVNDYLAEQFKDIMDYNFTANIEKQFDEIASGGKQWTEMLGEFYSPFHNTVNEALGTQPKQGHGERDLGVDPATGQRVIARIGRFGPMVQIGGDEGSKARFASLRKDQLIATITLEEALSLLSLPRTVGSVDGEEVVIGVGKFGPYVRYKGGFTSLEKGDDPYTITFERAMELVNNKAARDKAAKEPIKTFDLEPDLKVLNGRYGPYIAYKGKNYRLPKGKDPVSLTLEECREIVKQK
ncbi:MAG: type I DNA topoisomerase [Tidjanibacter sp.]|nr:type I DNA topoisomerase [Tidjanibacter sp.]